MDRLAIIDLSSLKQLLCLKSFIQGKSIVCSTEYTLQIWEYENSHIYVLNAYTVTILGQEIKYFYSSLYPLKKGVATHSSTLAWRIPWTEEPGRLQSMGLQSQTQQNRLSTSTMVVSIFITHTAIGTVNQTIQFRSLYPPFLLQDLLS